MSFLEAFTRAMAQEHADNANVLRIIAKDGLSLKQPDREALRQAADELELAQRTVSTLYAQLLETQQRLEALSQATKKTPVYTVPQHFRFFSMGAENAAQARIIDGFK